MYWWLVALCTLQAFVICDFYISKKCLQGELKKQKDDNNFLRRRLREL